MLGHCHVQQSLWWDQALHSASDLIYTGARKAHGTKPCLDHLMGSDLLPAAIVVSCLGHFRSQVWFLRAGPGKDTTFQVPFEAVW